VPFLSFGIDPLLGVKLLNLLVGIVTILAMRSLSYRIQISDEIRKAILISLVPAVLYFAFFLITPDLLVSCLLLYYFSFIFSAKYSVQPQQGMLCGLFGGVAYLAKSYSFPFFLYHFPLLNMLHYLRNKEDRKKTNVLRNFLGGMLLFSLISGLWILAMYDKYGYFTVSTQTKHNIQHIGPHPPHFPSFVSPPNETAISIWEDLYSVVPPGTWSPLESFGAFKHWLRFVLSNIPLTIKIFWNFSAIVFILSSAYIIFLILRPTKLISNYEMLLFLVTVFPYAGGYCCILADENKSAPSGRYIWILCFLFMLMGGYILNKFFLNPLFTKKFKITILSLFIVSFSITPVKNLAQSFYSGKEIYLISESLKKYIPPGSKIAASGFWVESLYLAYHLKAKIYGSAENTTPEELEYNLNKYSIDYYLEWENSKKDYSFLSDYKKIVAIKHPEITIYSLHKKLS
jgi:hypothetical protein